MASISSDPNGRKRILFVDGNGDRKTIRLGKMSIKQANEIKLKVEALSAAKRAGLPLDGETAAWIGKIENCLAEKLAAVGLIGERAVATLGQFTRDYIDGRTDIKPRTRCNLELSRRALVDFFGSERRLQDITEHDADRWGIALKHRYAEATAARTIKHARQFLKAACRARLVTVNPLLDVKTGSMSNPDRLYFVSREATAQLLDSCPDQEWRLIVALARFGGLRCPSEHLALTWPDVDWDQGKILIRSSKMEHQQRRGNGSFPCSPS